MIDRHGHSITRWKRESLYVHPVTGLVCVQEAKHYTSPEKLPKFKIIDGEIVIRRDNKYYHCPLSLAVKWTAKDYEKQPKESGYGYNRVRFLDIPYTTLQFYYGPARLRINDIDSNPWWGYTLRVGDLYYQVNCKHFRSCGKKLIDKVRGTIDELKYESH